MLALLDRLLERLHPTEVGGLLRRVPIGHQLKNGTVVEAAELRRHGIVVLWVNPDPPTRDISLPPNVKRVRRRPDPRRVRRYQQRTLGLALGMPILKLRIQSRQRFRGGFTAGETDDEKMRGRTTFSISPARLGSTFSLRCGSEQITIEIPEQDIMTMVH